MPGNEPPSPSGRQAVVLLLLAAAVVFAVIGALTVAKWLLIVAGILCVIAVVSAILDRNNRTLP